MAVKPAGLASAAWLVAAGSASAIAASSRHQLAAAPKQQQQRHAQKRGQPRQEKLPEQRGGDGLDQDRASHRACHLRRRQPQPQAGRQQRQQAARPSARTNPAAAR